jgi:HK97 family phage portal protein
VSMFVRRDAVRAKTSRDFQGVPGATGLMAGRTRTSTRAGNVTVTSDTALRHSAVWACLRLRADLMSSFPCDIFRDLGPVKVEMPRPPVLTDPGGTRWSYSRWMWASENDLDRTGNAIGLIRERNSIATPYYPEGLPSRIELQPIDQCSVITYKGELTYRIAGKVYQPRDVYHEMQYPASGLPVGLSPIAYAAWSIGEYLSLQQFALDWFGNGAVPKAWMRNTAKRLGPEERATAKAWYRDTIEAGDLMVTGNDWEYDMIQADTAGMEWLEGRRFGLADVARFFGAPADLIEAAASAGGNITYANITQRNLQFLIMNLGPAVSRREEALSGLLPRPRYVKLNTDALLRMDPLTRAQVLNVQIQNRTRTNSEARAYDDLAPLTDEQIDEFDRIYGTANATAPRAGAGEPVRAQAWIGDPIGDPDLPAIEYDVRSEIER